MTAVFTLRWLVVTGFFLLSVSPGAAQLSFPIQTDAYMDSQKASTNFARRFL